jgi:hypothetical protein
MQTFENRFAVTAAIPDAKKSLEAAGSLWRIEAAYDGVDPFTARTEESIGACPVQAEKVYKVGDFGPGGGWIFYDKGKISNGWRYLEAAPVDMEFAGIEWRGLWKNR